MQSTVESVEGNKVKLHITVPADEFERAIDAAFRKLAREVRVPGFRPGKAPRRLLEARLGTDIAREQALRDSLPEFYVDAVTEHDVDVIAPPEIEVTAGQEDGDVEFEAVVEVRPQVHLMGYDELRVELPIEPIGDDAIDDQVDRLRDRFADLTDSDLPLDRRRVRDHRHRRARSTARRSKGSPPPTSSTASAPTWSCPSSTSSCAAPVPARSSSSPRRCPSASATAPAKTRRSASS